MCVWSCYSYAEVRAEQRRELGIEESPPEISADKVCVCVCDGMLKSDSFSFSSSRTHLCIYTFLSICCSVAGLGLGVSVEHLQPEGGTRAL